MRKFEAAPALPGAELGNCVELAGLPVSSTFCACASVSAEGCSRRACSERSLSRGSVDMDAFRFVESMARILAQVSKDSRSCEKPQSSAVAGVSWLLKGDGETIMKISKPSRI